MYCSKCGVQNSDGSNHCTGCGNVLMDVAAQPVGGQAQPAVMPAQPKTCGIAIAAFVMGLLSFCGLWPILFLPAIICGIIALVKISKSNGQLKGTGFAVTGLVIPVVLGPMMLGVLLPALSKARDVAKQVICQSNLQGLSTSMLFYTEDYNGMLPAGNWCDLLIEEADASPRSFICQDTDAVEGQSCYAMNKYLVGKELGVLPPETVLLFETETGLFNQLGGPEDVALRHGRTGQQGCNILFADGHTEFVTEEGIADLQWPIEA